MSPISCSVSTRPCFELSRPNNSTWSNSRLSPCLNMLEQFSQLQFSQHHGSGDRGSLCLRSFSYILYLRHIAPQPLRSCIFSFPRKAVRTTPIPVALCRMPRIYSLWLLTWLSFGLLIQVLLTCNTLWSRKCSCCCHLYWHILVSFLWLADAMFWSLLALCTPCWLF